MRYYRQVEMVSDDFEYEDNQYEDHNGGYFEYREVIKARYVELHNEDYKGNPLVEALPPAKKVRQALECMENILPYSESERNLDSIERLEKIAKLEELFIFQLQHAEIASKIDRTMRSGYLGRTIPTNLILKDLGLSKEQLQYLKFEDGELTIPSGIKKESIPSPKGFVILGSSGSGKTSTVLRVLMGYPKVILHTEYRDEKFWFEQVPWIKIEGTYSRSIKGIGSSFFQQLDEALGTTYTSKFKRISIDDQVAKMKELCITHQIGLFVFDEVQYINQNSKSEVVNFLNKLHNELPIPIVYIGTYSLYTWMQNAPYTLVRRMEGSGVEEWVRMKNDQEFRHFLQELWHYQWIKNPPELTDEMVQAFYDNTMGITERVVRVFQLCQANAITIGMETYKPKDVKALAMGMPFTAEIIEAIKNQDYTQLDKLDGMIKVNMQDIIKVKKRTAIEREREKEVIKEISSDSHLEIKKLKSELMAYAIQLDFNKTMVENAIRMVTKGKKKNRNLKTIKQEMIQVLFEMKSEKNIDKELVPSQTALEETLNQRVEVNANTI